MEMRTIVMMTEIKKKASDLHQKYEKKLDKRNFSFVHDLWLIMQ